MTASSSDTAYLRRLPTSELICLPFLDTDTTALVPEADRVLQSRGWSPSTIRRLRRVAGVGLWWQVIAWEWASLDVCDVLAGYGAIVLALGGVLMLAGLPFSKTVLIAGAIVTAAGVALLASAVGGWLLRRGKSMDPAD